MPYALYIASFVGALAVLIRSEQASLTHNGKTYPVFPGMVSQVDILTGRKSILAYILKPINKARHEALSER